LTSIAFVQVSAALDEFIILDEGAVIFAAGSIPGWALTFFELITRRELLNVRVRFLWVAVTVNCVNRESISGPSD